MRRRHRGYNAAISRLSRATSKFAPLSLLLLLLLVVLLLVQMLLLVRLGSPTRLSAGVAGLCGGGRRDCALVSDVTSCRLLCRYALVCSFGTLECWGGRQGGCGPELCVRLLRGCGSQLAVRLVRLFVSACRSCVSSRPVQRPPIPRWCPVRAWLFFTFLPTYCYEKKIRPMALCAGL